MKFQLERTERGFCLRNQLFLTINNEQKNTLSNEQKNTLSVTHESSVVNRSSILSICCIDVCSTEHQQCQHLKTRTRETHLVTPLLIIEKMKLFHLRRKNTYHDEAGMKNSHETETQRY